MKITLFGIPNCDTVKKARAWLTAQGLDYQFHHFTAQGVPAEHLKRWVDHCGWETLLNRRGTTWRKLSPEEQASAQDAASAQVLMLRHPSLIKRPVVEWPLAPGQQITVGFDATAWAEHASALQNV
jgi:Spx/MgsR family transcriptional regulator